MSLSLAKYHARSPRYILQPQDNTFIRLAGPAQTPWEEGTEIRDISLTGISFTAPVDLCPIVGEFIKIQFDVPGGEQMACFGLVIRLQTYKTGTMNVGVQFVKLGMAHRLVLTQSLAKKLKTQSTKDEVIEITNHFQKFQKILTPRTLMLFWLIVTWILLLILVFRV